MALLVAIVLGVVLMMIGAGVRHRLGLPIDFPYLVKLLLVSFGVSVFAGFTFVPSLWMAIRFALWRGRLDDHLIGDPDSLLVGMVIGVLLGGLWALKEYRDTVRS